MADARLQPDKSLKLALEVERFFLASIAINLQIFVDLCYNR